MVKGEQYKMKINAETIQSIIDPRKCAKQDTIAIITNGNKAYIGSNWCATPKTECPRKDLPTGVGYDMCKNICGQDSHAEVDACRKAGDNANSATLYLIGHTYCCDNCKKVMDDFGIKDVVIGEYPDGDFEVRTFR